MVVRLFFVRGRIGIWCLLIHGDKAPRGREGGELQLCVRFATTGGEASPLSLPPKKLVTRLQLVEPSPLLPLLIFAEDHRLKAVSKSLSAGGPRSKSRILIPCARIDR